MTSTFVDFNKFCLFLQDRPWSDLGCNVAEAGSSQFLDQRLLSCARRFEYLLKFCWQELELCQKCIVSVYRQSMWPGCLLTAAVCWLGSWISTRRSSSTLTTILLSVPHSLQTMCCFLIVCFPLLCQCFQLLTAPTCLAVAQYDSSSVTMLGIYFGLELGT